MVLFAIVGGAISYLSARVPLGEWITVLESPAWREKLGIHGISNRDQVQQALDFSIKENPIGGYITLLSRHVAIPSGELWARGYGALGYVLVVVGVACVATCAIGAKSRKIRDDPTVLSSPKVWDSDLEKRLGA
jgi:hypothetical protein